MNGNPPPTAADNTVTTDEDVAYAFQAGDFNFTDDVNADDELASVTIVRLLTAGALSLDGTEVTADQEVTRAQLDAGQLHRHTAAQRQRHRLCQLHLQGE